MTEYCPICKRELIKAPLCKDTYSIIDCETCGKYIYPHSTAAWIGYVHPFEKDNLKMFLFHNKNDHGLAFIGTEDSYSTYIKNNPNSASYLVSLERVHDWYPQTFAQRIDYILMCLGKHSHYVGEMVNFRFEDFCWLLFIHGERKDNCYIQDELWTQINYFCKYFKDKDYANIILQSNAITNKKEDFHADCQLLTTGWSRVEEINRKNLNNKKAFVAMKFGSETESLREAIKKGIRAAGYEPVIMNEVEHNKQIVPEMLYQIRNSKFVIAELSHHNNGAYYEAGYAFGVGKEVIHICSEKALTDDLHFDVKQVNTITYKDDNLEELSEKIKHRIIATIV